MKKSNYLSVEQHYGDDIGDWVLQKRNDSVVSLASQSQMLTQ